MCKMLRDLALISSLLSVAACMDDGSSPNTSEADEDLTGYGIASWGQLDGHLDLGPAATQTCFLRGVHGSLKGVGPGNTVTEAGAVISIQGDHWDLYTFHGSGPGVSGQATCIPYVANRVTLMSSIAGPVSVPATANRQCFLMSVRSYGNSWSENLANGTPPHAQIAIEQGNWVLRSTVVNNDNPDGVIYGGHEEAVCVDVPIDGLLGWQFTAGSSTLVETVVPSPADGWACGLTGISGVFLDTWDRLGVEAVPVTGNKWNLTLAAAKGAFVRCIH
jgi:hypothetical protein